MGLGVLCLETYYSDEVEDRRSVRGLLELLEHNVSSLAADHRHVPDRRNIQAYLEGLWPHERYDVLYLASHGDTGAIVDEYGTVITLEWLARRLKGSCKDRVVFLSGCDTVNVSQRVASSFLATTGAAALVGYRRSVDWLRAAQMDLVVLGALVEQGPGATGVWTSAPEEILQGVYDDHARFVDSLGWRFFCGSSPTLRNRRSYPDGTDAALEGLFEIAEDESVDDAHRIRALKAVGQLNAWDPRLSTLVRRQQERPAVRKAALRALMGSDAKESQRAVDTLRNRLAKDTTDPGRESLRRQLGM